MQPTSPTATPRRSSLDEFIRMNTTQVEPAFTKSVRWERDAVVATAGEVAPAFDFAQPVLPTPVFAGFSFSAKVGL